MGRLKLFLLLTGLGLMILGYKMIGIAPDAAMDLVLHQVRTGLFIIWGGALLTVIGVLRRS